ncbi:MAG: Rpn family recombination-promoting nuclease/putative transposase, partial [candidate division Zixibacteria bacterium]|nr:Rpn family recombination-promoting nuclease/putative transposase [candidate division Zixibacteria bacterium]
KKMFSGKNEVMEFVKKTFPPEITENLRLETLELDQTEYVDTNLWTNWSDIVYNCKYGKHTTVKISLLFEHKSNIPTIPHLQLLGYMLKIWWTQINNGQKLTLVIPIIFYHGKAKWTNKPFEEYFHGLDNILQRFIPKFDYQLIDTSDFTDNQIISLFENLQLQIGIMVMKNIFDEQMILQEINKIFSNLNQLLNTEQGEMFFESIVAYLLYATSIDTHKYLEKMKTISKKAEKRFVSTAMKLKTEGIKEGLEQGLEQGIEQGIEQGLKKEKRKVALNLIKKGFDNDTISDVTGLEEKEVEKLRRIFLSKKIK